jgi:hypothetical protein
MHISLTSALVGGEWSASRPGHFTPGERAPGTHCIGGWLDPRAGLVDMEKRKSLTLPGLVRTLSRPACNQSLYRLRYPGTCQVHIQSKKGLHIADIHISQPFRSNSENLGCYNYFHCSLMIQYKSPVCTFGS